MNFKRKMLIVLTAGFMVLGTLATSKQVLAEGYIETDVEQVEEENTLGERKTEDELDELDKLFLVELVEQYQVNIPKVLTGENILIPTNLSAEDFNKLLEGTPLEGLGEELTRIEQEESINGLFLLSVANSESAMGKRQIGNNLFGMTASTGLIRYKSFVSSMEAFAKLIHRRYAGLSMSAIARKYCPPKYNHWTNLVNGSYNRFLKKLAN